MIEYEIVIDGKKTKIYIHPQGTTTMNWRAPATLGERLRFEKWASERALERALELEKKKK